MGRRLGLIGGGIVGLATARAIHQRFPDLEITLWEKEAEVGQHQSSHNSGVLHAGLYYKPGSLKAELAVKGIRQMIAYCEQHHIAHEVCGKLVVATENVEIGRLRTLIERGNANGLRGLEWLEGDQIREIEPHAAGIAAVKVPEEGIVDYEAVCRALRAEMEGLGVDVCTGSRVEKLIRADGGWRVLTNTGEWSVNFLLNCGGLHADRIARMAGENVHPRILPFRGEYYQLASSARNLVKHLIYPVPDPAFPFLGVHFTRLISGEVEAGPNAVLALAREGYDWRTINLADLAESLTFSGLWRFMCRHFRMASAEISRSLSRRKFCTALQRLVPEVKESDLAPGGAGVRAQALTPKGELLQDFSFHHAPNALHVLNAPSPGATASLAIGQYISEQIADRITG